MGDVSGLQIVIVGIGACVIFDVWQRIFERFTAIPPSNWAIVGRWAIGLLTSGQLMLRDLELRPNRRNELGLGWFIHYSIGPVYATIYMLLMRVNILAAEFGDGLLFGVVSVIVPWFFSYRVLAKAVWDASPLIRCLFVPLHR